ncbi:hypothetical protein O9993_09030 [Vibrio lentus]|nr:hypothetical protein [Vibrio lentus]
MEVAHSLWSSFDKNKTKTASVHYYYACRVLVDLVTIWIVNDEKMESQCYQVVMLPIQYLKARAVLRFQYKHRMPLLENTVETEE